jgi:formate dehydrogenase iron-sulfur subunit
VSCPFGVIDRRPDDGRAFKCTFCYDRQKAGLQPACATACPTESIQYGDLENLRARAAARQEALAARGVTDTVVYDPRETSVGGTHAIFLVRGELADYRLPPNPELPSVRLAAAWQSAAITAGVIVLVLALAFV